MLTPIFTLNLNQKILPGKLTIGKYDGAHSCLTACTSNDKIFVHNPYQRLGPAAGRMVAEQSTSDLSMLNINQTVTSLTTGRLLPNRPHDILVVGTHTNVLAYDVQNNADVFYKELPDGANAITIGTLGDQNTPMALVGGNCSIHGFDGDGNDPFWTVTGDNVSSVALADFDGDGYDELLVGSEDFDIRVFRKDEIISEMSETETVTALCPMQGSRFGYALSNGTVGVYEKMARWWRIKSKNQAVSIFSYDLDGDGVPELITGWSNGKIDARNDRSGEVVFKDNFNSMVAGIVEGDYRMDGSNQLICCSVDGEVRGYQAVAGESRVALMDVNVEQETLRDLSQRRHTLLMELHNYEENQRLSTIIQVEPGAVASNTEEVGIIPANTQLQTGLAINMGSEEKNRPPHVEISLGTTNDSVIRSVIIFAEGIFDGESHVYHPRENTLANNVRVPIYPPKDVPVDLHIKAAVGSKGSQLYHIFELTRQLPRFSMYAPCQTPPEIPKDYVKFKVNERVARVVMWLNSNFLLEEDIEAKADGSLEASFISLRSSRPVVLRVSPPGQVEIHTDEMDVAADIVQAMTTYLNIDELQVEAEFSKDFDEIAGTMEQVKEYQNTRQRLGADMADNSGLIKALIVRAEDARLLGDMHSMRKWYGELMSVNRDMISQYKIREKNHQDLLSSLKLVNQTIQRAARLRVGKPKTSVVNGCRQAIKNNNTSALIEIMKTGKS